MKAKMKTRDLSKNANNGAKIYTAMNKKLMNKKLTPSEKVSAQKAWTGLRKLCLVGFQQILQGTIDKQSYHKKEEKPKVMKQMHVGGCIVALNKAQIETMDEILKTTNTEIPYWLEYIRNFHDAKMAALSTDDHGGYYSMIHAMATFSELIHDKVSCVLYNEACSNNTECTKGVKSDTSVLRIEPDGKKPKAKKAPDKTKDKQQVDLGRATSNLFSLAELMSKCK